MADEPQTTVDTSGVARTPTGEIAQPVVTRRESPSSPTSTETPAKATESTEPKEGETLLSKDKAEAKPKAPETYADFTVPEGYTLDAEVAKEAGALFKGLDLSQEQAQSLVDFYTAKTKEAFEQPFKTYQEMRKGWRDEVASDRQVGHRLAEVKTAVTQMLDQHLGAADADAFREAMDLTGVGDHPAFIRAFDKLSQLLVEPRSHVGGARPSPFGQTRTGTAPNSAAAAVYPHLPSRS